MTFRTSSILALLLLIPAIDDFGGLLQEDPLRGGPAHPGKQVQAVGPLIEGLPGGVDELQMVLHFGGPGRMLVDPRNDAANAGNR